MATAAGVAASGGSSGDTARGADEPPPGNPKKPLLAAAAIAGTILLVVPLLVLASHGSGEKKDRATASAQADALLDDERLGAPPGQYAPDKPSPEASGKSSGKAKSSAAPGSSKAAGDAAPEVSKAANAAAPKGVEKSTTKKSAAANAMSTQRKAAGPPVGSAAYAVLELAGRNPGRHICYRAYVTGLGWQGTQCDGATAGTEGQSRPIKALNIAVSGTNGTAATPYIQGTGWAGTSWKGVDNGANLYIGTASDSASNMAGFAINVDTGKGTICQTSHIHDGGWLARACDTPASTNNYIFGGTLYNGSWLEAVRFTV
ncbi:hypothetical protein ACWCQW_46570 [Streptomyces mirabilis]